jgi:hypothetical protein
MRRTWILDTETKGTGANVVPLRPANGKRGGGSRPVFVPRRPPARPTPAPAAPRPRRRFKVVDVMTEQTLAEHADARTTIAVLDNVHRIVDVSVYIWLPGASRWRLLTRPEQRALWDFRHGWRAAG